MRNDKDYTLKPGTIRDNRNQSKLHITSTICNSCGLDLSRINEFCEDHRDLQSTEKHICDGGKILDPCDLCKERITDTKCKKDCIHLHEYYEQLQSSKRVEIKDE